MHKSIKRFLVTIRSLVTAFLWAVICCVFVVPCLMCALLPAPVRYKNKLFFVLTSWWSRVFLFSAGISVKVSGERLSLDDQPSIVVMNHGSALDIIGVEALFGRRARIWLTTSAYQHIPLLNVLLSRMHVTVDTSSPRGAAHSLVRLKSLAFKTHSDVLLFPEGRRWADGAIHDFFKGFVVLARKLKRPVRPVYIKNAHHILPPRGLLVCNAYQLELVVGPLMTLQEDESDSAFVARVRNWFVKKAL